MGTKSWKSSSVTELNCCHIYILLLENEMFSRQLSSQHPCGHQSQHLERVLVLQLMPSLVNVFAFLNSMHKLHYIPPSSFLNQWYSCSHGYWKLWSYFTLFASHVSLSL